MRLLIICVTAIIVIGICFYPPWLRTETICFYHTPYRVVKNPWPSQYAFLLTPPEYDSLNAAKETPKKTENRLSALVETPQKEQKDFRIIITASIDICRLSVQCAIVLLVGGGLAFLCRSKDKKSQ